MGSEVRAGGAFIEIYTKSKLKAGLDSARADLQAFAGTIGGIGAGITAFSGAILGGLVGSLFAFGTAADDLTDSAARIGLTTDALQELTYAAGQNGATMEDVERGLKKFEATLGKAEKGEKAALKTFEKYGLSVAELATLSPEEQLNRLADAIARQPDQATKAAAAMALLGKGGLQLLPMLSEGAAGLAAFAERARELGLVIKPGDVALGGQLADMYGTITQQAKVLVQTVGAALAPALMQVIAVGQRVLGWAIQFVSRNRVLVTTIALVASAIGAVGVSMLFVAGTAYALSAAIVAVNSIVTLALGLWSALVFIKTVAAGINTWLTATLTAEGIAALFASIQVWLLNTAMTAGTFIAGLFSAALAAIASPLGLIVIGIAAVGAALIAGIGYWLAYTENGKALIAGLAETVSQALGGIMDAVMAMDLGLAFNIALGGALIAFQQFVVSVTELWEGLKTALVVGITDAFLQIMKVVQDGVTRLNDIMLGLGFGLAQKDDLKALFSMGTFPLKSVKDQREQAGKKAVDAEKTKLEAMKTAQGVLVESAAEKRKELDIKVNIDATKIKIPNITLPKMIDGPGTGQAGAFSAPVAAMLGQMGQITVQEKQLEKLEEIAEGVDEVATAAKEGGLSFA